MEGVKGGEAAAKRVTLDGLHPSRAILRQGGDAIGMGIVTCSGGYTDEVDARADTPTPPGTAQAAGKRKDGTAAAKRAKLLALPCWLCYAVYWRCGAGGVARSMTRPGLSARSPMHP